MRAFVQEEPALDAVSIFVADDLGRQAAVILPDGRITWVAVREGQKLPPLLQGNPRVIKVLADALTGHASIVPATEGALEDARVVRDRLLTLVEQLTTIERNA